MKRYLIGVAACAFALAVSSFTVFAKSHKQHKTTDTFYELTNPSAPLQASSYMAISEDDYDDINCVPGSKTCKLEASGSLPTNLTDANHDNIPDVTGVVVAVPTKQ